MRVYIAGPMRGYPKFNFPAFYQAEEDLLAAEDIIVTKVFNPAKHDVSIFPDIFLWEGFEDLSRCPKFVLKDALKWDLARVMESDFILMLPEWEHSTGATLEYNVAVNCGVEVRLWGDPDALR